MVGHSPVRGTDELRELIRLGRYTEAVRRAGELADSPDPYVAGYTQLQKVAALFNLGHHDACSQGLDQAYEAARRVGDPVLFAEFHALAAGVAFFDEALDRSATHLVLGSRVLQRGVPDSLEVVDAYGDLAYIHSLMGFHEQAAALLDSSLAVAARLGEPAHRFSRPDIGLRRALYLDHCGQPEQATAVLRGIVREAAVAVARYGPDGLRQDNRATVRYAGARLAASGDGSDEDTGVHAAITEPLRPEGDLATAPEYAALRAYGDACCAIAAGSGAEALTILDSAGAPAVLVSAGEPHRLRAIAYASLGDHTAARAADRRAFAATAAAFDQARRLFLDAVAIRLDHEDLRRTAARYADQAHTDPLTGLPNRRHFDRYAKIPSTSRHTAVGLIDLDGFHEVNTVHGHLTGDAILQRVAGILSRMVRRGDLLARVGGDEFVLVLPDTAVAEAEELGARLVAAIQAEDWHVTVPGTPVSISIGWASLHAGGDMTTAYHDADRAMLRAKQERHRSRWHPIPRPA